MSQSLKKLQDLLTKMNRYKHVTDLLYWDMRTTSPKLGLSQHAEVQTFFSTEWFALSTSKELGDILAVLNEPEEYDALDDKWKYIVRTMQKDYVRNCRIPAAFFEEYVKEQNASEIAWEEAKNASDFSILAPHLEKLIDLTKKMYAYMDPDKEVYDAMLLDFEADMDSATIDGLFEQMKKELVPLVQNILKKEQPDDRKFHVSFDLDGQRKVQELLLKYIGFRFDAGAVGETEHPFTMNFSSKDVRVTNHFHEHDPLSAFFSAIHEGGHAIFEQNVDPDYDGTVAGSCRYMGLHESQSRFYENILGRNIQFWKPVYDSIKAILPEFNDISLEELNREINHIRNSFIRTDADELTYTFHIILRYELEKAIFRDGVSVDQLPELWNRKMQEYLQITPQNDAEGILQDMHWPGGSFGYFPSYLLGTIYDGMFLEAIEQELGSVDELLAKGEIGRITAWLNEKIHRYGSTRTPKEVLQAVCKKEVTAEPIIRYFQKKYTELYDL